jgi:hypothetical protein
MVNRAVDQHFGFLPFRHLIEVELDDQSHQRRQLRAGKACSGLNSLTTTSLGYLRESNAPVFAEVITCQKPQGGDLDEDQYVVSRC